MISVCRFQRVRINECAKIGNVHVILDFKAEGVERSRGCRLYNLGDAEAALGGTH